MVPHLPLRGNTFCWLVPNDKHMPPWALPMLCSCSFAARDDKHSARSLSSANAGKNERGVRDVCLLDGCWSAEDDLAPCIEYQWRRDRIVLGQKVQWQRLSQLDLQICVCFKPRAPAKTEKMNPKCNPRPLLLLNRRRFVPFPFFAFALCFRLLQLYFRWRKGVLCGRIVQKVSRDTAGRGGVCSACFVNRRRAGPEVRRR